MISLRGYLDFVQVGPDQASSDLVHGERLSDLVTENSTPIYATQLESVAKFSSERDRTTWIIINDIER